MQDSRLEGGELCLNFLKGRVDNDGLANSQKSVVS